MDWLAIISVTVFAVCVALIFYAVVGYPLLTFVLAAICRRHARKADIEPTVTFIVSAYNEEDVIEQKILNTLEIDYPKDKFDIVIASDGSTDATDEITRRFSDQGVRLLRTEGRLGKTLTLDEAIKDARGEIVVCSDATSVYEPDSVRMLVRNFADPTIGGVCGRVGYRYDNSSVAKGFGGYQSFVVKQRMNESLFGHQTQLSGAIHAIRKNCFIHCPAELSTEEWNAIQIARQGMRTVYEYDAITWEQSRSRARTEFKARVRMALQCLAYTMFATRHGFTRNTLLYTFENTSGKVIRWFLPLILMLCFISGTVAALTIPAVLPFGIAMWAVAALAGLSVLFPKLTSIVPGLSVLSFFTVVMAAFSVALVKFIFAGKQAPSWEPDRSDETPPPKS